MEGEVDPRLIDLGSDCEAGSLASESSSRYERPTFVPKARPSPFSQAARLKSPTSPLGFLKDLGSLSIENKKGKPLQTAQGRVYTATGNVPSKTFDFSDYSLNNSQNSFLNWNSVPTVRKTFMTTDTENKNRAPKGYVPPVRDITTMCEDDDKCAEEYAKVGDYDECLEICGITALKTIDSWTPLDFPPALLKNIVRSNYPSPRQVQRAAMPLIMDGYDIIACTETGSGKTLAFLIPMIAKCMEEKQNGTFRSANLTPYGLIICPTRELAHQLSEQACKLAEDTGVTVSKAYGEYAVLPNTKEMVDGCDILICTPGRLQQFYKDGVINFRVLHFLVFDEGDLLIGEKEFMDDIHPIITDPCFAKKGFYQTLFFSATFSGVLIDLATKYMRLFSAASIFSKRCATNKLCLQQFQRVEKEQKLATLVEILQQQSAEADHEISKLPRVIIFVNSRHLCHELAEDLLKHGFPVTRMSGNYAQNDRIDAWNDFRNGKYPILVTTDVCARGLDIKNVHMVLNYELPWHVGSYIYRVGRVGRIKIGECLSFADPRFDKKIVLDILNVLQVAHHPVSADFDEIVDEVKVNIERDSAADGNFNFFIDDNRDDVDA